MSATLLTVKCAAGTHRVATVRSEPAGGAVVTVLRPSGDFQLDLTDRWATLAECACGVGHLDSPMLTDAIRGRVGTLILDNEATTDDLLIGGGVDDDDR